LRELGHLGIAIKLTHLGPSLRAFSTSHGGLRDQDRIFTNVYNDTSPFIDDAMKRVMPPHLFLLPCLLYL
jgi:NADH dehydrogenase (ubiquinone) flavoprotein 1